MPADNSSTRSILARPSEETRRPAWLPTAWEELRGSIRPGCFPVDTRAIVRRMLVNLRGRYAALGDEMNLEWIAAIEAAVV